MSEHAVHRFGSSPTNGPGSGDQSWPSDKHEVRGCFRALPGSVPVTGGYSQPANLLTRYLATRTPPCPKIQRSISPPRFLDSRTAVAPAVEDVQIVSEVSAGPGTDRADGVAVPDDPPGMAINVDEWHAPLPSQQYQLSYPTLPLSQDSDPADPSSNAGSTGWLFGTGSAEPTPEHTVQPAPRAHMDDDGVENNNMRRPDGQPLIIHDADAPVREGFMCPTCMTDFPSAEMLQYHFTKCSLANKCAPSDSDDEDLTRGHTQGIGATRTPASPPTLSSDPTKIWANAVPTFQYQTAEQPLSNPAPKSGAATSNTKGHMVILTPRCLLCNAIFPPRYMPFSIGFAADPSCCARVLQKCLRCKAPKVTASDAFCSHCGKPHEDRLVGTRQVLTLVPKEGSGYGLGFKNHTIYRVSCRGKNIIRVAAVKLLLIE